MKTRLAVLTDTAFISFVTFLLSLALLNNFLEREFALTFTSCICALTAVFSFKKLSSKSKKLRLDRAQKQERDLAISQLNLYTLQEQTKLFEKLLEKLGYKVENKRGVLKLPDKNVAIFCKFGFDYLTKTDIVKIFNSINAKESAYILCEKVLPDIKEFANRFDDRIKTVDVNEIYKALSDNELLPKTKFSFTQKKTKFSVVIKSLFEKKKAKTHFYLGLTFLLTSYIVPIKIYYVIFGCIFLTISLICFLYGRENAKTVA